MTTQRKLLTQSAIFGLYFALAALITWPLIIQLSSHLYGGFLTDAFQTARHIWWIEHAIKTGQPIFFQPALGYPDGLQGAWIWANPLEYFPGWLFAFVMPVNAALNLMVLVQVALNGWAMQWLVYHINGRKLAPALLAGLIFMAYPAVHGRIYGGHVGVLALWPLLIYLYAAYQLQDSHKPRWFLLAIVFLALSIAGNSTLLVYYALPTAGLFLLWLLVSRRWGWFRRAFVATAAGGVLALVFLVPLALETANTPQYDPGIGHSVQYSADLLAFAAPSFFHPVFNSLDYTHRTLGLNLVEGVGYVGIIAGLLAVIGVWRRPLARWWLILALLVWVFSMGPLMKIYDAPVRLDADIYETYVLLPWGLFQNLPVFEISRTPGRFNLTVGLAIAVMAGYGFTYIWDRLGNRGWRWLLVVGLGALILFEYQVFWPTETIEPVAPEAASQMAERDDIRAVFSIPWDHAILAKHGLYLQIYHQQDLITGQFVRDTPVNPAKLNVMQETLDPAILDAAGVDVIVWHKEISVQADQLDTRTRAQLGQPYYEDENLALFNVPPVEAPAAFTITQPPESQFGRRAEAHFYAPGPGWVTVATTLSNPDAVMPRQVALYLDDERYNSWQVAGDTTNFNLTLPVLDAGFHTARLQLEPPCPVFGNPTLTCHTLHIDQVTLDHIPDDLSGAQEVVFSHDVRLGEYFFGEDIQPGEALPVLLWWDFTRRPAEDAVRFVHVLDESGALAAQADGAVPVDRDQTNWVDFPAVVVPEEPGTYRVYAGWYRFPDLERFPVESAGGRAMIVDNSVLLGTFEVE